MNKIFTLVLFSFFLLPVALKAQITLSGNYTIGGTTPSPDFGNITDAVNALNAYGIAGNVVFNIRPGTYPEQFTLNNIKGVSASDSIIFQSETLNNDDVNITYNGSPGNTYVVRFNKTHGVTFRYITFSNLSLTNCTIGRFLNGTKDIRFEYNQFFGPGVSSQNDSLHLFYSIMQNDTALTFNHNYFEGGDYGLYLSGNFSTPKSIGLKVAGNKFEKQAKGGIHVADYASNVFIYANEIDVPKNTLASEGIYAQGIDDFLTIENNKVSVAQGIGIYVNSCHTSSANDINIFNNRIATLNGDAGIAYSVSKNGKIISNTIYTAHQDQFHYAITVSNYTNTIVQNNLMINNNGGTLLFESVPYTGNSIDLNVYAGSSFQIGKSGGTYYGTLSAWKIGTTFDANSLSVGMPNFVGDDFKELRLSCNGPLQISKSTIAVPKDFQDQPRTSVTVWPGADEYYGGGGKAFVKGFAKYGTDTVKAGKVVLYANITTQHKWDVIDEIDINSDGSFASNGIPLGKYMIQVVPDESTYLDLLPTYNGGNFNSDTLQTFLSDTCNVIYQNIDVVQLLATSTGGAKISGYVYNDGSFKTNDPIPGLDIILDKIPPSKSVQKTKTDAYGYYEFNNLDTGHYQINIDVAGILIDSLYTVDITDSSATYSKFDYCIDSLVGVCFGHSAVPFIHKKNNDVKVWPNPIQNQLKIQFPAGNETYRIDVVDIVGKQVYSSVNAGDVKLMELDFTTIPEGIYIVKISSENSISEMKVIKQ
jgi:hypothetical protein